MVSTRKSTGSLPPPKVASLAENDSSDDDGWSGNDVSDEEGKQPARKRVKKGRNSTRKNAKASKQDSKKRTKMGVDHDEASGALPAGAVEKKPNRLDSLITGPYSKKAIAVANGKFPKGGRKDRVRKSDLGKLARIMDLSVEVFCEIATYLTPIDLLHLSRTSRTLRDFLMSKSSKAIWVTCRTAIEMPQCPSDMSEPQYANLYFEKECHACGYPRVERLPDHLRIRLCKGCSQLNIVQGKEIIRENFDPELVKVYEIYSLLPWSGYRNTITPVNVRYQSRYYLKYDFIEVVKAYLQTKPNSDERKAFVKGRHRLLEEIVKSTREVAKWQAKRSHERLTAEDEMSKKRKSQIRDKLHELGYSLEEIDSLWSMPFNEPDRIRENWTRHVYQPRELTDRIWNNLRDKLIELIYKKRKFDHTQEVKRDRQKRKDELLQLYEAYAQEHRLGEADDVPLCFVDLCDVPFVNDLIEEDECRIGMTDVRWRNIEDKLPEFQESHARKVEDDCLTVLLAAKREAAAGTGSTDIMTIASCEARIDADIDRSLLRGADAFFFYNTTSTFSEILSFRRNKLPNAASYALRAWDANMLKVDVLRVQAANVLLASLNLPEDTTMEYVQSLGKGFVCQQCDPILRKCMEWRDLVNHFYTEALQYKMVLERDVVPEIPFFETHKITTGEDTLAVMDRDFVEPSVDDFTYANEYAPDLYRNKYCEMCQCKGAVSHFLYKEQYDAHVRTYHGEDTKYP